MVQVLLFPCGRLGPPAASESAALVAAMGEGGEAAMGVGRGVVLASDSTTAAAAKPSA